MAIISLFVIVVKKGDTDKWDQLKRQINASVFHSYQINNLKLSALVLNQGVRCSSYNCYVNVSNTYLINF